jgi:hypothetical protein
MADRGTNVVYLNLKLRISSFLSKSCCFSPILLKKPFFLAVLPLRNPYLNMRSHSPLKKQAKELKEMRRMPEEEESWEKDWEEDEEEKEEDW